MGPHVPKFDDPKNLALWDVGPRLSACLGELVDGLHFSTKGKGTASISFIDAESSRVRRHALFSTNEPSLDQLKIQLELVAAYADLRGERAGEIVSQLGLPIPFWSSLLGILEHRQKKTLQLMNLAFLLANHVEMRFKNAFAVVRPVELSAQIQPMIPTPGHGSYPSGHATEAFTVAHVLHSLMSAARAGSKHKKGLEELEVQLQRLAYRIAVNRTVAGVHYPVDSALGRVLGTSLGEFLVSRASRKHLRQREFLGDKYQGLKDAPRDFNLADSIENGEAGKVIGQAFDLPNSPLTAWLWEEAVKEWQ